MNAPKSVEPAETGSDDTAATASRAALRVMLLAQRAAYPGREHADAAIAAALSSLLESQPIRCLGFYWPIQNEFDARDVVSRWLAGQRGRTAALPVVTAPGAPLDFHEWAPATPMRAGRYNIPVPADTDPAQPDALLIPCVGFSDQKLRLGYGGGFYDRTLAALSPRPIAIGIGFGRCRIALDAHAHDLPMDWLVTESGTF